MGPPSFRVEAVLPAPARTYFLERDSAAFRSLLSKVLKIGQLEFNDLWREGNSSFVRMITKPEFGSWVPKGVASQLNSNQLEFHDIIEYNPAYISSPPYKIFVRTESPFLKDKLDIQLTLTIEELDDGARCRQILEGHIHVKMFGVGRIVESIVKDSLHNTYKKLPEIVRRWQLFREDALRTGDSKQLLLGRPPVGCEVQWIRQEVLQILKEPLLDDGTATPVSALCPVGGASEASDNSPAALARTQQRMQQLQQEGAAAHTSQVLLPTLLQQGQPGVGQEEKEEEEGARYQDVSVCELSRSMTETQYYDAREGPEDEVSSAGPMQAAAGGHAQAPAAAAVAEEPPRQGLAALAAAVMARGAHHRRGLSLESVTSIDTPEGEEGHPGRQQPMSHGFWRRFNRHYTAWDAYWDEVGVEQEEVEGKPSSGGIITRALYGAEDLLRSSYYSTSILVALFLMRHGWLRVEGPDANANPYDESIRQHAGHRHSRSGGSSASGRGVSGSGSGGLGLHSSSDSLEPPLRSPSLARVAQEVRSRMVSGSHAVANAPVKAVAAAGSGLAAAGSSMQQARVTGARSAKAIFRPKSKASSGHGSMEADEVPASVLPGAAVAARAMAAAGAGLEGSGRQRSSHRKTMSLDSGTAAAARLAAAAAVPTQRQSGNGMAFQGKPLERRASDMAAVATTTSMHRAEHKVQAPSRLSCFAVCGRPPKVKD